MRFNTEIRRYCQGCLVFRGWEWFSNERAGTNAKTQCLQLPRTTKTYSGKVWIFWRVAKLGTIVPIFFRYVWWLYAKRFSHKHVWIILLHLKKMGQFFDETSWPFPTIYTKQKTHLNLLHEALYLLLKTELKSVVSSFWFYRKSINR